MVDSFTSTELTLEQLGTETKTGVLANHTQITRSINRGILTLPSLQGKGGPKRACRLSHVCITLQLLCCPTAM